MAMTLSVVVPRRLFRRIEEKMMFPLRVHSHYSLLRGSCSPRTLCRLAKEHGYTGLALTDRDNLYGLWEFLAGCGEEGLTPVVGAELTEPGTDRSVVCLVRTEVGYAHLCNLISLRHTDPQFSLEKALAARGEGLVILGNDEGLMAQLHREELTLVADLGPFPDGEAARLKRWAQQKGVLAIATPDSYCAQGEEEICLLLRAIGANMSLSRVRQRSAAAPPLPFESKGRYQQRFHMWPEVVAGSATVAAMCRFTGPQCGIVMPPWQGRQETAVTLRSETYRGACRRYGNDLAEAVVDRLEYELQVIEEMGFSAYFLVVRDIVHRLQADGSRKKRRICGRGSGAASLVAYCLEITNVCPVKHNLYFERFLNPGRTDPPDIDIDFAWDERDEVLAEVLAEHGQHAAMVANHVFFQPRMAIRETAKAFGLPGYEISRVTKKLSSLVRLRGSGLQDALATNGATKGCDLAEPWPEILAMADKLVGIPRYLSVHPGGVIITPRKIRDYVPVQRAAKGVPIIQWEKDGAEEAGLVKIDLLGNRSLGVIRDCLAGVRENGHLVDEEHWVPEEDSRTRMAVAKGKTMGCFYIESPAMRLLQQKAATGDFEQLVIQSSIIRPAANDFVREYVRRLQGGLYQALHPLIGDVLDETFGLMVYQEDVSRVAVTLAGFSHARADGLRKVLSKKDRQLRLRDYREEFFAGCRESNVATDEIEAIWQMMMSFDGYSFCKPHSASYAKVSFQAAYLKCHYPAEFMAAVISNRGGYYSTFAYVSEAKRLGLTVLPPDVNRSAVDWRGKEKEIRVGLQEIKGLSVQLMARVCEARKSSPYRNVADFVRRTQPAEDEARALVHAGALDSLQNERNRTVLLWKLAQCRRQQAAGSASTLFSLVLPPPPPLAAPPPLERLRREYRELGFLCGYHPIVFFDSKRKNMVKACALGECLGRRVSFAGWLLTGKMVSTKTGEVMEFLTFEDETGTVESTFFPRVYKRYAHILSSGRPYILQGLVEADYGAVTLTVDNLILMDKVKDDEFSL